MTTAGSPRPLLPGPPHIAITNHDKFVKEQGRSPGSARTPKPSAWKDARPAPRRTRVPTTLAGRGGRCATCYGLERLAAKLAARSPCLECHQSFLLCVLDSGQGSCGSCGLGRTVCTSRAGRPLPLRTRATPPWTRTHPHFPGLTGHASPCSQTAPSRFVRVRTRPWNSRPVATQYKEHNWGAGGGGGGCATARGAGVRCQGCPSSHRRDPESLGQSQTPTPRWHWWPRSVRGALWPWREVGSPGPCWANGSEAWAEGPVPAANVAEAEAVATVGPGSVQ